MNTPFANVTCYLDDSLTDDALKAKYVEYKTWCRTREVTDLFRHWFDAHEGYALRFPGVYNMLVADETRLKKAMDEFWAAIFGQQA